MNEVVPYLLPIPAGWFITVIAVAVVIGLLIGILKVQVKTLKHLQGPKIIWGRVVICKYCDHTNELDIEEQCSESFTCSVCRRENTKEY